MLGGRQVCGSPTKRHGEQDAAVFPLAASQEFDVQVLSRCILLTRGGKGGCPAHAPPALPLGVEAIPI